MGACISRVRKQVRAEDSCHTYNVIPCGTVVSLRDLKDRPDLTGVRGEIQKYSAEAGLYSVLVLKEGEGDWFWTANDELMVVRVQPSNLLQHADVRLCGIESQPHLNGSKGTIVGWENRRERYSLFIEDTGKLVLLKPLNVILKVGTVGRIVGLVNAPEYNGSYGTIKAWVRQGNRYEVQLSPDRIVLVKVGNFRV